MKETKSMEETKLLFDSLPLRVQKSIHAFCCEDHPETTRRVTERLKKAIQTVLGSCSDEDAYEIVEESFRLYCEWRETLINQQ